ncbi:MAG TPA: UpxY family transcription antiterminator [Flavobacteriaceae bacterium]|nr:UpxY family transcription antiterminator [Flavobacteriaceae bacterium]
MTWQVLYVNSRAEIKVADRLSEKGFEVFCPLKTVVRQWSDRKKKLKEPYFRSYVFIRLNQSERLEVLQTPGVVGFVFWLRKPAVIPEKEMAEVIAFFDEHQSKNIICESFEPGQTLVIKEGLLQEKTGIVVRQSRNKVVLQIQQLGISLSVEVPKNTVGTVKK